MQPCLGRSPVLFWGNEELKREGSPMPQLVTEGALLTCTMGTTPCPLNVVPKGTFADGLAVATITDMAPGANIASFGMCISLANPAVAAATAAAQGVLTPQPCLPVIVAPWAPPSVAVAVAGVPAVLETSTCACAWAGVISITFPGQITASGT